MTNIENATMPVSSSDQPSIEDLAEEFLERRRRGERPSLQEYAARYPDLAGEIREFFPVLGLVEDFKPDTDDVTGSIASSVIPGIDRPLEQLGDFRLLREVGRGGMGIVYEAEQVSLGRRVALKILPRQVSTDRMVQERFRREARAAARLHHTNIVPVFEVGQIDSICFYAMQFIRGLSLDAVIDELRRLRGQSRSNPVSKDPRQPGAPDHSMTTKLAQSFLTGQFESVDQDATEAGGGAMLVVDASIDPGPDGEALTSSVPASSPISSAVMPGGSQLSAAESSHRTFHRSIAHLGRQATSALAYAHARGVVHRDIKPSNLLLDTEGTVWVTDFGLAKTEEDGLTQTGDILGTIRYLAPERFQSKGDLRADIYALGLTLFELLVLRPAFDSPNRMALVELVKNTDPPRPRSIDPRIPRDLETIVLKAIEKDPKARYQTCEAMGEDLRRFLADEPIVARPLRPWERAAKWAKRRPIIAALVAAVSVLLACLLGLGIYSYEKIDQSLTVAKLAGQRAEEQFKAASARAEDLAWQDYINRVNRAYREIESDNAALAEDLLHGCPPERRGWEWHFVERLCNSERMLLDLGNASVNALAFSPDGSWLVSGSGTDRIFTSAADASVDLYDSVSGQRQKTFRGVSGSLYAVAVSPDGRKVAAGSGFSGPQVEGRVALWDAGTGRKAWAQSEPELCAMSVSFSPDGKSLAVGYGFYNSRSVGKVRIWDVASGKPIKTFPGPPGGAQKVAYHPGGKRLAVTGAGVVEIWEIATETKVDIKGHKNWVYSAAFSHDGKWLATGGWDRTVKLWDAESGLEKQTFVAHEGFVLDLAFSPDDRTLATVSEDRSVRLWEVPSARRMAAFHGHTDFVQTIAFRPNSQEIASGGMDGSLRFWDTRTSRPVIVEQGITVTRLAIRRDGLRALSESDRLGPGAAQTIGWDPMTGEIDPLLTGIPLDKLPAEFVAGASHRKRANVTSPDGTRVARVNEHSGTGISMRSREYGDGAVIIQEVASGREILTLTGHSASVVAMAFSPDGRRLATASYDRTIKLWDTTTGQNVFTLAGHTAGVDCLAFSPDGNQIISGGFDATARVWNATPLPDRAIAEHDGRYRRKLLVLEQSKDMEFLAASGQWQHAAAAYGKAVESEPDNFGLRFLHSLALLKSRDLQGYRRAATNLLARFGRVPSLTNANNVAWCLVLAPDAVADRESAILLAETALSAAPGDGITLNTLGAALYRAGRFQEAIRRLEEGIQARGGTEMPQDWAFLAMAHHALGHHNDARRWLDRLVAWKPKEDAGFSWDEVEIAILRREAEALIVGSSPAAP